MSKPDKYLIYTADHMKAVATHGPDVILEVLLPDAGLTPGVTVAFRMTADEARSLAKLLLETAAEAESGQSRPS